MASVPLSYDYARTSRYYTIIVFEILQWLLCLVALKLRATDRRRLSFPVSPDRTAIDGITAVQTAVHIVAFSHG